MRRKIFLFAACIAICSILSVCTYADWTGYSDECIAFEYDPNFQQWIDVFNFQSQIFYRFETKVLADDPDSVGFTVVVIQGDDKFAEYYDELEAGAVKINEISENEKECITDNNVTRYIKTISSHDAQYIVARLSTNAPDSARFIYSKQIYDSIRPSDVFEESGAPVDGDGDFDIRGKQIYINVPLSKELRDYITQEIHLCERALAHEENLYTLSHQSSRLEEAVEEEFAASKYCFDPMIASLFPSKIYFELDVEVELIKAKQKLQAIVDAIDLQYSSQ